MTSDKIKRVMGEREGIHSWNEEIAYQLALLNEKLDSILTLEIPGHPQAVRTVDIGHEEI